MIPKCLRFAPIIACLVSPAFAEDREKLLTELRAAYGKLDGFLVVYHAEEPGKTLEAKVAMDDFSGLGFVHMQASRPGTNLEARMWNTEDDTFVDQGRGVVRIPGLLIEMKNINDLERALNPEDDPAVVRLIPSFFLKGSQVVPFIRGVSFRQPSWEHLIKDATVKETTDEAVAFATKEYGLISISRKNGLMIRQEVDLKNDAKRVLKVKSLHLNPGRDAVLKLSAAWPTNNAPSLNPMPFTAPYRLEVFQRLIDKVEKGTADLAKLESTLTEKRDALRHFAEGCINERPGSVASKPTWKGYLDQVREQLLKTGRNAEGNPFNADELALELKKPEVRNKAREALVRFLSPGSSNEMPADEVRDVVMKEIFGTSDKAHLTANGDDGKAAAALIRDALSTAFIEAVADRKMAEYWDKDGSLD